MAVQFGRIAWILISLMAFAGCATNDENTVDPNGELWRAAANVPGVAAFNSTEALPLNATLALDSSDIGSHDSFVAMLTNIEPRSLPTAGTSCSLHFARHAEGVWTIFGSPSGSLNQVIGSIPPAGACTTDMSTRDILTGGGKQSEAPELVSGAYRIVYVLHDEGVKVAFADLEVHST